MLLSLRFSLDTSLFPEGIISLFHFRLTFLVEIGTMKHDVKFARCKYPAGGAQGNVYCHSTADMEIALYIMEYHHPPKTGLRCDMRLVLLCNG